VGFVMLLLLLACLWEFYDLFAAYGGLRARGWARPVAAVVTLLLVGAYVCGDVYGADIWKTVSGWFPG